MKIILFGLGLIFYFSTPPSLFAGGAADEDDQVVRPLLLPERTWSPIPEETPSPKGRLEELNVQIWLGAQCHSTLRGLGGLSNSRRRKNNVVQLLFHAKFETDEERVYVDTITFEMSRNQILTAIRTRLRGLIPSTDDIHPVKLLLEVDVTCEVDGKADTRTHLNYTNEELSLFYDPPDNLF